MQLPRQSFYLLPLLEPYKELGRQSANAIFRPEDAAGHGTDGIGVPAQPDNELHHRLEIVREPAEGIDSRHG